MENSNNPISPLRQRFIDDMAYGAGLRISEVVSLRVCDIDSQRMVLKIEQGKGSKDRLAKLSPAILNLPYL